MIDKPLALIIEDDEKLADIVATIFQLVGYETRILYDGKIAQTVLAVETPAVVVLDLHLPHIPGIAILQEIRAKTSLDQTQVVIITADVLLAIELQNKGEVNVFIKPVSFNKLRNLAVQLSDISSPPSSLLPN